MKIRQCEAHMFIELMKFAMNPLRSRSNSTPTTTIISGGGGVGADMIMVATVVVGVMTPQIMISLITR